MDVISTQMAIANLTKADAVKQKARNEQEYLNLKKTSKTCLQRMNIEALDDDCFKAILSRLPFADFVRAGLVSTRFRCGTELALDSLAALTPISLEVYGNCEHLSDDDSHSPAAVPEPEVPQIFLSGINVPPSKFSTLPTDCKYLANVSRVHLHAAHCESLPPEFRTQLCDILRSLPPSAAFLEFSDDSAFCSYTGYFAEEQHEPFFELTLHCTNWLSTLETIVVPGDDPYTPKNKSDFFRLLTLTGRLRSLTAEVGLLFDVAGRFPVQALAGLEKLVLKTRANQGKVLSKSVESCQNIVETVCEHCPNLLDFSFTCCESDDHTCLSDFSALQSLSKLRNFCVCLCHEKAYPLRIGTVPSIESMKLHIPWKWPNSHLVSLTQMAPNLKSLYTSFVEKSELLIDQIITTFSRQLKLLSMECSYAPAHLYPDFDRLFTLQSPVSLRRVKLWNRGEYTVEHFNMVLAMISRAENISQFELCVRWHQESGLGQLQSLLLAMQHGSIRQLILHGGFEDDATPPLDKESVLPLLSAVCEIREWNITSRGCQPDSILMSGYKSSYGAEAADVSGEMFWVQLHI